MRLILYNFQILKPKIMLKICNLRSNFCQGLKDRQYPVYRYFMGVLTVASRFPLCALGPHLLAYLLTYLLRRCERRELSERGSAAEAARFVRDVQDETERCRTAVSRSSDLGGAGARRHVLEAPRRADTFAELDQIRRP